MSYEEFKNKVSEINNELLNYVENKISEKINFSSQTIQILNSKRIDNSKDLNSLAQTFNENKKTKALEIQEVNDTITALKEELDRGLETFEGSYNSDAEYKKLIGLKDKVLLSVRNKYRKDIHEVTYKTDKLEKEQFTVLQDKNEQYEEENKNHKAKIIEIEKRRRFEVQRIQNNTIKEYDDKLKQLLSVNTKKEIAAINKVIKTIRKDGIIEEKTLLTSLLEEQRDLELYIDEYNKKYSCELIKIKNNYTISFEKLALDRILAEHEYQVSQKKYEFEVKHNVNRLDNEMQLKKCTYIKNNIEEKNKINNDIISKKYDNALNEYTTSDEFIKTIKNYDTNQINSMVASIENDKQVQDEMILELKKVIQNIINEYYNLIKITFSNYLNALYKREEMVASVLCMFKVRGGVLQGYSYEQTPELLNNALLSLDETFKARSKQTLEKMNQLLIELNNKINDIYNEACLCSKNLYDDLIKYNTNVARVLENIYVKGNEHLVNVHKNNKDKIQQEAKKISNSYDSEIKTIDLEIEKYNKEYEEKEAILNKEIAEDEKLNLEYTNTQKNKVEEKCAILRNEIKKAEEELPQLLSMSRKQIMDKYNNSLSKLDKEYQVKINLL